MRVCYKPFVHAAAIAFIVLLIYSNTFKAPFQFDDFDNIVYNPAIKDLHYFSDTELARAVSIPEHVKLIFKTRYIGYLTFVINYKLHGLDLWGYHLVNILIHIADSLLLYWLISLTFKTPYLSVIDGQEALFSDGSRNFIAVFTALLFAVHPIQTQAVTYIVQRFVSLATLFYLLSLVMYIKARQGSQNTENEEQITEKKQKFLDVKSILFYPTSVVCSILAMKTKEIAFTLPVIIVLYEFMFFEGTIKKRVLWLIPLLLTMLIIPLSLVSVDKPIGEIIDSVGEATRLQSVLSRWDYLFTQFRVIVTYIRLLFIPVNQNFDYDYPVYASFFTPEVVMSFLFLLSILIVGIYLYLLSRSTKIQHRYWYRLGAFGIFWFFITLSVESSIIPIADVIFEHRLYLPSIGFFMSLSATIEMVRTRWASRADYAKNAFIFMMILAVCVLSSATYARNAIWKDSVSLCKDNVRKSPNKARPYHHLALAYDEQGRVEEAIGAYKTALKINYAFSSDTYNNLGVDYEKQGRMEEAIYAYKTALQFKYDDADIHYNLANAYVKQGRIEEAISEYKTALVFRPDDAKVHYFLGIAYTKQGRIEEAISEYQIVVNLNPNDAGTRKKIDGLNERMKLMKDRR